MAAKKRKDIDRDVQSLEGKELEARQIVLRQLIWLLKQRRFFSLLDGKDF